MRAANHFVILAIVTGSWLTSCAKTEKKDGELASLTNVVTSAKQLPTCSSETISQVYWVEEQDKLYVCNGSTFVEIQGEKGEQGEQGETGSQGPAGSPANSGVWVFDKDSKAIGVLMDARLGLVLFTNGSFASINLATGDFGIRPTFTTDGAMETSQQTTISCSTVASSCAGSCYIYDRAPRGTIIRTGASTYVVATGEEQRVLSGLTEKSQVDLDGTCRDVADDSTLTGYAITKAYALPTGITLPLKTPLSFGFKTEE